MKKPLLLCAVFSSLFLAACGVGGGQQPHHAAHARPVEKWVDFNRQSAMFDVPAHLAGVVFYRLPEDLSGPSANVYVGGEYLASLLPGGFRYALTCPHNRRLSAEFTGVPHDDGYLKKAAAGEAHNLAPGGIAYFKLVTGAQNQPKVMAVSPEQARADLQKLRQQTHTLPRVGNLGSCDTPQVAAVQKTYTLDASALFEFDRADYAHMLPQGKREISAIAREITQGGMNAAVRQIKVVGHTDPEGNEQYNQRLSYQRAQTVKQALVAEGLDAQMIVSEGMGEQMPVVGNCRQQHPRNAAARKQCDQANRRVEIVVYGFGPNR